MAISISSELLYKFINVSGVKKSLLCVSCKNFTEHVSVSWAEGEKGILSQIVGRLSDIAPTQTLLFGNPFACTVCGRVRHEGGLICDWYNEGNVKRLELKK